MGVVVVDLTAKDNVSPKLDNIDGSAKKLEKRFASFAKTAVARLGAITAATFAVGKAFDTLKSIDQAEAALTSLGVNANQATATFSKLSSELRGQASAVELTAAAYDVASAGFTNISDQTKILEAATMGAVGGMSDLNTVGNAVTSVLNAYGMSADQAGKLVDGFIQTQNDGKIIIEQYANQIGRLAPTAAAAGVGIEQLNAALSTITAKGVAPEQAITGLNMALVAVLKPSGEATALAKELGIEFNEAALKSKGLGGVLAEVAKKTGGSTTKMTKLFGSVDALKSVLALTSDGLESFEKNLKNQGKAAGVARKAFKDMSNTLDGSLKGLDSSFKNLVVAFKPLIPAIVAPIDLLAAGIQLAADKFRALATAAAFFGTLAAFANANAIAVGLLAIKTGILAVKTKIAAVAAAALQAVMNPANIAKIAIALGVAAGASAALGAAMQESATEGEEGQAKLVEAANGATDALNKQPAAIDAATEAKKRLIEATKSSLEFLTQEKTQIEAQKSAYQNTINVTNARLNAEKAINDLQGQILERAYEQASSATQRLNIAKQIFENEVNGAKIAYQQTLNSIQAEEGKLQLKRQGAVIDGQILKARGEILVAEAKTVDEKRKAQAQAQKALDSQMQVVRLLDGQIQAQAKIGQHQVTAAKAQLEAKVLTARQNLEQKLVSKEIAMSQQEAVKLSGQLANSNTNTQNLAIGTGQVAENARQSSFMFIEVANQASNAANQINRAATAQRNLNAARAAQASSSSTTTTEGAAAGAYWKGGFKAFAKGGMVKGPTLGLIGEGGEPEYIIPQSKAAGFAANFLSGKRGTGAIPGFADGGVVAPSSASVNIQTGPVTQMGGQNYVTMQDMSQAVQAGVEQTLQFLMSDGTVRTGVGFD
tara:strand:- start:2139 stop:4793 length:2655 start_codon:yes stop_codon:yes gene_type:complete